MLVLAAPLEPRIGTILQLGSRSTLTKQSGQKPVPLRWRGLVADESLVFQLLHEIRNVREQFRTRQPKFFFQGVQNFIYEPPIFDHLPDPGSNPVHPDTKTLIDIQ